jgi:SPP1 gp7 family putative phage head morphogenesis protein
MARADPRLLRQRQKQREARAKAFERALMKWLNSYSRYSQRLAIETVKGQFKKQQTRDDYFAEQLATIMNLYGAREAGDSANMAAGSVIVPGQAIADATEGKGTSIKWFWRKHEDGVIRRAHDIIADTQRKINEQVNEIVVEALTEIPQPSAGALARRIKAKAFEGEFMFSDKRAAMIARTELTQAQNSGTFEGYKATGVKMIEWLAFNDNRSGDRQHNKMNGEQVKVGESFYNETTRTWLRYPGDPTAPIGETINCRCTVAPVI